MLNDGTTIQFDSSEKVIVRTLCQSPFIAVGIYPSEELGLVFIMPAGTLFEEVQSKRLRGHQNLPMKSVLQNGHEAIVPCDILRFDFLSPAVQIVLDNLESSIQGGFAQETGELLADFVDLFGVSTTLSDEEITGLWGELVFINSFDNPENAIKNWHESLDSRYDFAVSTHRIEVKTSLGSVREHSFSSNQLPAQPGTTVAICSVLAEHTFGGETLSSLWKTIRSRVHNTEIRRKLDSLILRKIKKDPLKAESISFDLALSESSMMFFDALSVPAVTLLPGIISATWKVNFDGIDALSKFRLPEDLEVSSHF